MATTAKYPGAQLALADLGGEPVDAPSDELTLNGDITAIATSFVVNEAIPASWPASGWVEIENEIIHYSSFNGGTKTFTVDVRGAQSTYGGSAAAPHTTGTTVGLYLSAQSYAQVEADLIAVEGAILSGFAHDILGSADNVRSLGSAAVRWLAAYFSSFIAIGTSVAATGAIRFANALYVVARNAANNADKRLIGLNASDQVSIDPDATGTVVGGTISSGASPAASGQIRLPNATSIAHRNAANGADITTIGIDSADKLKLGSTDGFQRVLTEFAAGNTGATPAVDWNNGDIQAWTATANATFTFSNPVKGRTYMLKILQDATGARTYTWPAAVKWPGGTAPTGSAANKTDLISFYYDGTNYWGSAVLNY